MKKRIYIDLPDCEKEVEKFNEYLLKNNEVIENGKYWLLINNKYIKKQLVCFLKLNKKYLTELNIEETLELYKIIEQYKDKHIYINADKKKSIRNRLHIHIKI